MMLRSGSNRVVPDMSSSSDNDRLTNATRPSSPHDQQRGGWMSPRTSPKRKMRELVSAALPKPSPLRSPLRTPRIFKTLRNAQRHKHELKLEKLANQNLTQFLIGCCPTDVLPKILAYAGPLSAAALQQTSRHFRTVLNAEGTWRGLCEELYKWKPGDPEPDSWKDHYRLNPCVPVDFTCVTTALAMAGAGWSKKQVKKRLTNSNSSSKQTKASSLPILEIPETINVWVRPGQYEVKEAIGISTLRRTTQVRIKRMEVPKGRVYCHSDEADVEVSLEESSSNDGDDDRENPSEKEVFVNDVIIESKTRRRNEPLIRVFRGQLVLDRIKLEHYSAGIDIWNGNAAIQVQPSAESNVVPLVTPTIPEASAVLNRVEIRSYSGRGVVAVEGGHVYMDDCHIHHCAATGVYIGGNGSKAIVKSTDVIWNGLGNQRAGGIARGHSGVYVEQGKAELEDCSVSNNTAAGISVIADDNSALVLSKSEVVANGCTPVELPNPTNPTIGDGSNHISVIGTTKPRSIMLRSSS